jgi:hypothetical protein
MDHTAVEEPAVDATVVTGRPWEAALRSFSRATTRLETDVSNGASRTARRSASDAEDVEQQRDSLFRRRLTLGHAP